MLLFSGDLVHLSEPNLDDRRRAILFLTFNALNNSPEKGVGPSRYYCAEALQPRDDEILVGLVQQFEKGQYKPEFRLGHHSPRTRGATSPRASIRAGPV